MNIDKAQPMNPQVEQIKLMNVDNPNDKPALFAVNCCHCGGRPKVFMQISNQALMEVSQDGLNCDTIGRRNNQRLLLHCSCSAQPAPTPEAVMDGYETLFDAVDAWNRENMPTEKLKDIHKLLVSLDGELSMGVDGTIFLGRNIAGHGAELHQCHTSGWCAGDAHNAVYGHRPVLGAAYGQQRSNCVRGMRSADTENIESRSSL